MSDPRPTKVVHYAFGGSNPGRGLPMTIHSCRMQVITFKPDGSRATNFSWVSDKSWVTCKRCLNLLKRNHNPHA